LLFWFDSEWLAFLGLCSVRELPDLNHPDISTNDVEIIKMTNQLLGICFLREGR
jgi:hypothetical protein